MKIEDKESVPSPDDVTSEESRFVNQGIEAREKLKASRGPGKEKALCSEVSGVKGELDLKESGLTADEPISPNQRFLFAVVDLGESSEWRSGSSHLSDVAYCIDSASKSTPLGSSTVYRTLGDMVKDVLNRAECDESGMEVSDG